MINAVMITVAGREAVLSETLRRTGEAGITVDRVFRRNDVPAGLANLAANGCDALRWAVAAGWENFLFLEDDIAFSTDTIWRWPEIVCRCAFAVTLYTPGNRFYPSRQRRHLQSNAPVPFEVCDAIDVRRFFGSQAVCLTRAAAIEILEGWTDHTPFDTRLGAVCARAEGRLRITVPNLVQHIGGTLKSTWSPYAKPHISRSFGLEVLDESL